MYCGNCGNKVKPEDGFCGNCGNPLNKVNYGNSNPQVPNYNVETKKKGNGTALAIIIPIVVVLAIIGFIAGVFIIILTLLSSEANKDYVDLSGDEVPTINYVIGERNICSYDSSYSGDEMEITYEYCDNDLTADELDEYIDYLIENEGFTDMITYPSTNLVKESDNSDMYIGVEIYKNSNTIIYYKYELNGGVV